MVTSETDYILALQWCDGIGPVRFHTLISSFGTAEKAWKAPTAEWLKAGFSRDFCAKVDEHRATFSFSEVKRDLARREIRYLPSTHPDFPKSLIQITDCPIGLFIKGELTVADTRSIAVVGTRKVTPYGREVTQKLVTGLSGYGLTIVSGLARGIDGIAHRTALENGGRTLAVLGSGLDCIYPPEHKGLAQDITTNGALISEYPPDTQPLPGNFPARNRIISGLSLGVLVTEGSTKSGTNITAMMAVEQNRDVFAVPGPITSQMSEGPAKLIQMGAKLVMSAEDIVSEYDFISANTNGKTKRLEKPAFENADQEKIWEFLSQGNRHIDDIIRSTSLKPAQASTALIVMELKGWVKNLGDGMYMVM